MTEPMNNESAEASRAEARLEELENMERNLQRGLALQFAQEWAKDERASELGVEGSLTGVRAQVRLSRPLEDGAEVPPVIFEAGAGAESGQLYGAYGEGIGADIAAERLGISAEDLDHMLDRAGALVGREEQTFVALSGVREEHERLTTESASGVSAPSTEATSDGPEWATNSLDEVIDPARVASDWVQSTTMVRAYLDVDRPDRVREWIEMLDENLSAFAEGEMPPGSDELESVYHDAIARAAIPYGEAPISPEEVRRQLGNISRIVPEFDLESIRASTGISPLDQGVVTRALEKEAALPTGMEEVAEARLSVRRAMASITEDTEAAREFLGSANRTLTQALEGMRPDQGRESVVAAQESVQQASEKVAAVAETAAKVDAEVTVYTTDGCPGCFATKRALDKAGVEYDEIPLKDHPELLAQFKRQLGKEGEKITAPVVQTRDGDLWSGYQPNKLREHGLDHRTRQQRSGDTGRETGQGR